ncbi:Ribose import binding protein RbsB [Microbacterium lemovicicum]|jgi:ribose transport system substrate-binding protein|uniref:Ribose import binding protein RbsB n=1 Tax=Microbacterium lemovicicum TaxID=1072463 RepID=A0A3Q9J221_9MICO|nr:ABC transporter substrate-binding protein [Microbacterium lemovicicum]AZS38292.1 Ribose import binding protein RbsB [Microbacterium lemovicicum]AZS38308.1 Ribose import binding protein RbsB [Microbacterium lemovicicum]
MKWNKKVLAVAVLGASASLALAGCAGGSTGGGSSAGAGGSDGYKIAFVQGVAGDEFYISMQCGIEAAAKDAGATVTVQGPEKFDPTLQKPIVDAIVASKPDALLIAPTDVSAMEAPIKAAADAGIKVVLVDTTLEDPSMAVSQISSDNKGGGAAAFDAIKEAHPEGGKVLVVSVDPGISTTDARAEGFEDAVKGDSSFQSLGVQYSHNEPATAAEIVTAALQKDPDIVGIFAANLFAAEGSATGVKQAGKDGAVTIVGFDAGPAQVQALKAGTVQALVAQEPGTIGSDGVAQALAALNGETPEATIQTGFTIITKDNVDGDAKNAVYQSTCG